MRPSFVGKRVFHVEKLPHPDCIREKMQFLHIHQHDEKPFASLSCFYALLSDLYTQLTPTSMPTYSRPVRAAMDYLSRADNKRVPIEALARQCALSPSYFYACFKQETGLTPAEYRSRSVIAYAQQLLVLHPDLPIELVSQAAGFDSSASFRRLFKSLTGISPLQYRKSAIL